MLHRLLVPAEAAGERLDVWLEAQLEGCSRSLVARCIKEGRCSIEPGKAKPGFKLRGGEALSIEVPEIQPIEARPETLDLDILFEDEDLVVVDKAPGMVVHPAIGHLRGTLINGLLGRYGLDGGDACRPGLIHRLDADTSGVIAVARSAAALAFYQEQFRERRVRKRYLALLAGAPRADRFEVDAPLGRHPKDFRKRAVVSPERSDAKWAQTAFVLRQRHDGYAVVEARPVTGRTHQIRVHAAHAGHPVLADAVYGRHDHWPLSGPQTLTRQALHAWRLELPRPDGSTLTLDAPIPPDLVAHIEDPASLSPL